MAISNLGVSRGSLYNYSTMQYTGELQNNSPLSDSSGGQIDNWVTVVTRRCSLDKLSGRLSGDFGKMEYQKAYRLVIRYGKDLLSNPSDPNTLIFDSDSRWLINGNAYKIEDWELVSQLPFQIEFRVILNNG